MGRPHRPALGGAVYHVLNRANARLPNFESPDDFDAFVRVLETKRSRTTTVPDTNGTAACGTST
jgi:putative transposase